MYSTHLSQAGPFKALLRAGVALMPMLWLAGCSSMSNTDKGVLGGAAVGGVAGGILGHVFHNTAAGAAIGAVTGGVAGGLTGAAVDKSEAKAAVAANQQRAAMAMTDVVNMSQQGIGETVIINQIRTSGAVFALSGQDIIFLRQNGVTEAVIREMQATAYRQPPARVVYTDRPPVYVVEPAPAPVVGVGVVYGRRW